MKIAVIYQGVFPPVKGASGGDRRVGSITRGLAEDKRTEVEMLIPSNRNPNKENPNKEYQIKYLGAKFLNRILPLSRISYWFSIVLYAFKQKTDIILFYGTSMDSIPIAYFLKLLGFKVAYELCDLQSASVSGFKKFYFAMSENYLPRCTHLNIVISRFLEKYVKDKAPNTPVLTIPILVDSNLFKSNSESAYLLRKKHNIKQDDILIAYAGGTWKEEGVFYLMSAFKLLSNKHDNIKLIIAGRLTTSERHDDITGFIKEHDLSEKIITPGWIDTNELISIYSAADILGLPQIQHGFNVAGLPTKLAEYASMGKAILATRVGDVELYFKDKTNVVFCNSSDPVDMAAGLERLISDNQFRIMIGKNAKKTGAQYFDDRINGVKMVDEFSKLLSA